MKPNRLFVFDTIGEACRLWRTHFRLILMIALVLSMVEVLQNIIQQTGGHAWWAQIVGKALLGVLIFILDAVKNAVLLTMIIHPGPLRWQGISNSINRFGARLVGLHLLIAIIAGAVIAAVSCAVAAFGIFASPAFVTLLSVTMAILWVIFLKYALADPLIVNENYNAMDSLRQSWRMTRSHLTYVPANYIVIGSAFALVGIAYSYCVPDGWLGLLVISLYSLTLNICALIWVPLAWCMYQRIKEADAIPETQFTPTT